MSALELVCVSNQRQITEGTHTIDDILPNLFYPHLRKYNQSEFETAPMSSLDL